MEDICLRAIELGIREIAFTDHMDIDYSYMGHSFQIKDLDAYMKNIEAVQQRFKGQLIIKKGVEIGLQPQILDKCSKLVSSYPFDFVIASVHLINGVDPYLGDYYRIRSKEESYIHYYREILPLVEEYSDFSVLGHLDYVKRYSPYPHQPDDTFIGIDIVDEIFKILIDKNKGIELNTSGYHQPFNRSMPDIQLIKRYRELGGKIITIGSDAHRKEHIGFGLERAIKELQSIGFDQVYSFTRLVPIPVRL